MAPALDFATLPERLQALTARVDALDPPTPLEIPDDLDAPSFDELDTAADAAHGLLAEAIEPAMDAFDTQLRAFDEALGKSTGLAADVEHRIEEGTAAFQQSAERLAQHVDQQCDATGTVLGAEYDELHAQLEQLHGASRSLADAAHGFAEALPQRAEAFASRFGTDCVSAIESQARQLGEACETALRAVQAQLHEATNALDGELHAQLGRIEEVAASGIRDRVDAAGQKIVQRALQDVASAVAGAIAQITVGVQLTSMMSPVLPQMIVLNKCADALLAAIDTYKMLKVGS
jgi:DNA anti-recombination protein RmuC